MKATIEKFFELVFPREEEDMYEEIFFSSEKSFEFFQKLEELKVPLYIVKDSFGIYFKEHYLFWFSKEDVTYKILISEDDVLWGKIEKFFSITFPMEGDYPWRKEIPWKEWEKFSKKYGKGKG